MDRRDVSLFLASLASGVALGCRSSAPVNTASAPGARARRAGPIAAGPRPPAFQPWSPDLGDGTYKNPVLYADYSTSRLLVMRDVQGGPLSMCCKNAAIFWLTSWSFVPVQNASARSLYRARVSSEVFLRSCGSVFNGVVSPPPSLEAIISSKLIVKSRRWRCGVQARCLDDPEQDAACL